jgi:hypothetical protein
MAPATAAAAPDTQITSGPSGLTNSKKATFKFTSDARGATFECSLDGKKWIECDSPKKYSKLKQGAHEFEVRARKGHGIDGSPALRDFIIDTKAPDTTITGGPEGAGAVTYDRTPTITFSSNEPGTFECKLQGIEFVACESPFTPATDLPDGPYTFEVRARDVAGNLDKTPAALSFQAEREITKDMETAQLAAAFYFPDTVDLDVPASCGGSIEIDCVNGTPLAPADQLRVASTRSVVELVGQSRYDLTTTTSVQTLIPIKVNGYGAQCEMTLTSANGASPTWEFQVPMNFDIDSNNGRYRIVPGDIVINRFEAADVAISGSFLCASANWGTGFAIESMKDAIRNSLVASLCDAPGPAYIGLCTE